MHTETHFDNNRTSLVTGNEVGDQHCEVNNYLSSEELRNDGRGANSDKSASPKKEFRTLCSINTLSSCESAPRKNSMKNNGNEKKEEECSIEANYSDNHEQSEISNNVEDNHNNNIDACNSCSNNNNANCDNKLTTNKQSDAFTFKNTDKNTNKQSIHELKQTLLEQASKEIELYTSKLLTFSD